MFSLGRSAWVFSVSLGLLVLLASPARAQSVPATFTLNGPQSQLTATGQVTGDFDSNPNTPDTTLPIASQFGLDNNNNLIFGNVAKWNGTISAQIGYDPTSKAPIRIRFTAANASPDNSGNWKPGKWDPTAENPTGDPGNTDGNFVTVSEPAEYGFIVGGVIFSAIRDSVSTITSNNNAVTGTSYPSQFNLQYTGGFLDLNAAAVGTVARDNLVDDIPNPFANVAAGTSNLTSVLQSGSTYNVDTTLNTQATLTFPLGDFTVAFTFTGNLKGAGSINLPRPGDATNDGKVTGADYTLWAANFNKFNVTQDALYNQGDWNGDGKVTGADYTLWAANFGVGGAGLPGAGPNIVPEPSTLALAGFGLAGLAVVVIRRRIAG